MNIRALFYSVYWKGPGCSVDGCICIHSVGCENLNDFALVRDPGELY